MINDLGKIGCIRIARFVANRIRRLRLARGLPVEWPSTSIEGLKLAAQYLRRTDQHAAFNDGLKCTSAPKAQKIYLNKNAEASASVVKRGHRHLADVLHEKLGAINKLITVSDMS